MNNVLGETSNYSMSDFYKVLKWIPRSKVDRQFPVAVDDVVVDGDCVVLPTIYEEFNGIDEVQFFINFHGVNVDVSNLLLDFSPLLNGNISLLQANCSDTEIDYDNDTIISFLLDDNVSFTDQTRIVTGVKSLKLSFGSEVEGIEITNVLMRCQNYTYTLTDIEQSMITGENHVLNKLGHFARNREVPKKLQDYVYMAAGAYAWLSRWEYETKPMKEPKSESNNYADRLLGQVDSAIAEYLADIENKKDHRDLFHATYRSVDWGI